MDKAALRHQHGEGGDAARCALSPGRVAESLRRLAPYRAAGALFVGPALLLRQVRINVLGDGKELLMPAAGLQKGFLALPPNLLPFGSLPQAVTPQGMATHGRRLDLAMLAGHPLGLLVSDAVAVDRQGVMVGEGKGFFDLAVAIFQEAGVLAAPFTVVAVTDHFLAEAEVDDPQPWDVRADVVIHPGGTTEIAAARREVPAIHWEALSPRQIRRITPLWQLAQKRSVP